MTDGTCGQCGSTLNDEGKCTNPLCHTDKRPRPSVVEPKLDLMRREAATLSLLGVEIVPDERPVFVYHKP